MGYLLSGPTNLKNTSALNTLVTNADDLLSQFCDLETIGVKDDPNNKLCKYEKYSNDQLKQENGRYTARLAWRHDHNLLQTN